MQPTTGTDPVLLTFDAPDKIANWRPLVHWLLVIPHYVIAYLLNIASQVVWIISFFTVLFTEQVPESLFRFQVMVMRYHARMYSYAAFMREAYPPFDFTTSEIDPGNDPLQLSIQRPEKVNRWLPLVKWLLAIPHFIVLAVYVIGAFFVVIAAFFAVLFTGRYPAGMRGYLVKVMRYALHIQAYMLFLRDEYPSFSLK
jgi:hypothetical protein